MPRPALGPGRGDLRPRVASNDEIRVATVLDPAPPISLDKLDPGQDDASGGLVLRKQKVAVKSSSTKKNNQKIKF